MQTKVIHKLQCLNWSWSKVQSINQEGGQCKIKTHHWFKSILLNILSPNYISKPRDHTTFLSQAMDVIDCARSI